MRKKNHIDPIPGEFPSAEAAAEFWETHDTTNYPSAFRTLKATAKLRRRHYEITLAPDVVRLLHTRARRKHISLSLMADELLRQQLRRSR